MKRPPKRYACDGPNHFGKNLKKILSNMFFRITMSCNEPKQQTKCQIGSMYSKTVVEFASLSLKALE